MSNPNAHERLVELVTERQLAEPTPEDVRELEGLLQSSIARRLYIELINLQGQLETLLTRRTTEDVVHQLDMDEIFEMLRQAEDAAPDVAPAWQTSEIHLGHAKSDDQPALTLSDTTAAVSYLVRQQVKRHRVFLGSIAALLIVGVVLALSLLGGSTDPDQPEPIAATIQEDEPRTAVAAASVATLTATHNATWSSSSAERALARGSQLRAGDRLTLTSGIAQITTNDGAIAILEAPATIELLDNDNAIRLHTGKLLGICETESSKGFLVRAPHMDITDLGTRFGVDATDPDATQTHVLEGVVRVDRPSQAGETAASQTLEQDQAVIARAEGVAMEMIALDLDRFASITPRRIELPGTGKGLSEGEIDSNWRVMAVDGKPLTRPEFMKVGRAVVRLYTETPRNDPAIAQWLDGNAIKAESSNKRRLFTCRTFFELPQGVDPNEAALVLHFDADESVERVRLNGQVFEAPKNSWDDEHTGLNTMRIDHGFTAGINTIELDVLDIIRGNGTMWNFYLEWHIETGLGTTP